MDETQSATRTIAQGVTNGGRSNDGVLAGDIRGTTDRGEAVAMVTETQMES